MVEIQSHLVTLQKGKLKADVSYITDHIQSPKAYLIRSKHEVTTCYSGMKKCTGRKEEEEKFLITDYFITYLEKSAFWYKFVLFMMVLIRQYNLFFFSLGPFPLCKKMEEGGIQKEDDVEWCHPLHCLCKLRGVPGNIIWCVSTETSSFLIFLVIAFSYIFPSLVHEQI